MDPPRIDRWEEPAKTILERDTLYRPYRLLDLVNTWNLPNSKTSHLVSRMAQHQKSDGFPPSMIPTFPPLPPDIAAISTRPTQPFTSTFSSHTGRENESSTTQAMEKLLRTLPQIEIAQGETTSLAKPPDINPAGPSAPYSARKRNQGQIGAGEAEVRVGSAGAGAEPARKRPRTDKKRQLSFSFRMNAPHAL